jgi:hypothetical protein
MDGLGLHSGLHQRSDSACGRIPYENQINHAEITRCRDVQQVVVFVDGSGILAGLFLPCSPRFAGIELGDPLCPRLPVFETGGIVQPGSPGEKAGFQEGDILLHLNGKAGRISGQADVGDEEQPADHVFCYHLN